MVLRDDGHAVICITQPAHAWVSGQLATAWDPTPDPEVVLAVAQHDLGMAAWDAEPELNPDTGRPYSFLEMPLETHLRLWTGAPRLALSQSRLAALMVSMHGAALYDHRAGAPEVDAYLEEQRSLQSQLRASLEIGEEEAARLRGLLLAWDWMSLVLCMDRLPETAQAPDAELALARGGGDSITVEPWPFATPDLEVVCDGRRLEGRFDDQEQMRAALARAPWLRLRFELSR